MGDERPSHGAARQWVQRRRLHLDEAPAVQNTPDRPQHRGSGRHHVPALQVRREVQIPAANPRFRVAKAVELLRKRAKRLGEKGEVPNLDRQLPAFGLHDLALGPDDVAQVEIVHDPVAVAHLLLGKEELDVAGRVAKGGEGDLAVGPFQDDPSGHGHVLAAFLPRA